MDFKEYGTYDIPEVSFENDKGEKGEKDRNEQKASKGKNLKKKILNKKNTKDTERTRKITAWFISIVLILVIVVILFSKILPSDSKIKDTLRIPEKAIAGATAPVETVFSSITNKVVNYLRSIKLRSNIEIAHNEALAENEKLTYENMELRAIIEELTPYKEMAGEFQANIEMNPIIAKVIGNNSSNNYFSVFSINKGSRDGIEPSMAVTFGGGLVGYTEEVTEFRSKVRTVIDSDFHIASLIETSRLQGTISGTIGIDGEAMCRMTSLSANTLPRPGERVITSGIGIGFPKGIPIGTVRESTRGMEDNQRYIVVEPIVDLKSIEEVMILRYKPEAGKISLQGVDDSKIVLVSPEPPFPYTPEGVGSEEDPNSSPTITPSPSPTPTPTPSPSNSNSGTSPQLEYIVPKETGEPNDKDEEKPLVTPTPTLAPEATIPLDDMIIEDDE